MAEETNTMNGTCNYHNDKGEDSNDVEQYTDKIDVQWMEGKFGISRNHSHVSTVSSSFSEDQFVDAQANFQEFHEENETITDCFSDCSGLCIRDIEQVAILHFIIVKEIWNWR